MDLEEFLSKFVRNSTQHKQFYHFTDKRNVDSIKKYGLLSTAELRSRGLIENVVTGGDANSLNSDTQKGTDQYVCLCLTANHPMCHIAMGDGRKLDPTYLHIDPEVIKLPGVMVTSAASNQSGVERKLASVGLDELDLPVVYTWMEWKDPKILTRLKVAEKYELLVPKHVPLAYVKNL